MVLGLSSDLQFAIPSSDDIKKTEHQQDCIEKLYIVEPEIPSEIDLNTADVAVYKVIGSELVEDKRFDSVDVDEMPTKTLPSPMVSVQTISNTKQFGKRRITAVRTMGPVCNCELKCYEKVNRKNRQSIFNKYYRQDTTRNDQKDFILARVIEEPVENPEYDDFGDPKTEVTLKYTFLVNNNVIEVCKTFFLNTLCLTEASVNTAIRKGPNETKINTAISQEQRRPEEMKDVVRKHIEAMCKHVATCGNVRRQQLMRNNRLNISACYALYLKYCAKTNIPKNQVASEGLYRSVASREYNIVNRRDESPDLFTLDYVKND